MQRLALPLALTTLASLLLEGIVVLVWAAQRGYDISDEGFYLYAAEPANASSNANGLWGMYLGLLYRLAGFSLVTMRLVGILLLVGSACWFSSQVDRMIAGLVGSPTTVTARVAVVISTLGAALLYYGSAILTPSYNLVGLCSILVALGGAFGIVAGPATRTMGMCSAVAISVGSFVAFWCRSVAGAGVWVVCIVLVLCVSLTAADRAVRLRWVVVALAALVVLGTVHSIFVLSPGATISAIARARDFNFVGGLSVPMSTLVGQSLSAVLEAPGEMLRTAGLVPLLGVLPALAAGLPPTYRGAAIAGLASGSVVLAGVSLALSGAFNGGLGSYETVTPAVLAIGLVAGIGWVAAAWVRRRGGSADGLSPRSRGALGAVVIALLLSQWLYAFTSNNGLVGQTSGASVLGMLAAELLLVAAVGRDRSVLALVAFAVVAPIAFSASAATGIDSPHRGDGALTRSDTATSINVHGSRVLLTQEQARYFHDLVVPARSAGFKPGTPLIDLTPFSPGSAVALGAAAPTTLLFGYSTATARWALSRQDRDQWQGAWLLVTDNDDAAIRPESVVPVVGRSFPDDYVLVTTAVWPFGGESQQLWRPRTD